MVAVTFVPGLSSNVGPIMAMGLPHRLSSPAFFNKTLPEIVTMPFLRAFLFLTGFAVVAAAQTVPAVPPGTPVRSSDAVATQPNADSSQDALPGPRPSRIRVLAAADRDLFVRA